jgi:hypothetical protein
MIYVPTAARQIAGSTGTLAFEARFMLFCYASNLSSSLSKQTRYRRNHKAL